MVVNNWYIERASCRASFSVVSVILTRMTKLLLRITELCQNLSEKVSANQAAHEEGITRMQHRQRNPAETRIHMCMYIMYE